jgi:general secretion pathway protein I
MLWQTTAQNLLLRRILGPGSAQARPKWPGLLGWGDDPYANVQPDADSGFTLVEVVVALAILALSVTVLLGVISDGLRRTDQAARTAQATALAQALLARLGTELPVQQGETSGELADGLHWRLRLTPYGDRADRDQWPVGAYHVSAEVSWGAGGAERSVLLTTLRLGAKEPVR